MVFLHNNRPAANYCGLNGVGAFDGANFVNPTNCSHLAFSHLKLLFGR